jgi:hypothetical protein
MGCPCSTKIFGTIRTQSCLGAAKPIPALRGDHCVVGGAVCFEETNVARDHTSHYPDPHSDRCAADVAVQLGMGILSVRRIGTDPRDRAHPRAARPNIVHPVAVAEKSRGSSMSDDRPRIVKNTTEAREGVTGHNVRYVLIISVVGAGVVLAGLWLYYFA